MRPFQIINPAFFSIDLVYSFAIMIICFLIYYKTKEIFELTKYRGIQYFRISYLLLGVSFVLRFLLNLEEVVKFALDWDYRIRFFTNIVLTILGFISTMAIFTLAYSRFHKRISSTHYFSITLFLTIALSIAAGMLREPIIIFLLQFYVLIGIILAFYLSKKKDKNKVKSIQFLYFLTIVFWIINIFPVRPRFANPLFMTISYIIKFFSLGIFLIIFLKVNKWTK